MQLYYYIGTKKLINFIGNNTAEVSITTSDYQPGEYTVTINFTDVYGQTSQMLAPLFLTGVDIHTLYINNKLSN